MPQVKVDNQAIAQIELHSYLEAQVQQIAPNCSGCKHYTRSNNFLLVGYCDNHEQQVMGCDRACSFILR